MNANITAIGIAIATKITVLATAKPHVNGIIHNTTIITANAIKIVMINCAIAPNKDLSV